MIETGLCFLGVIIMTILRPAKRLYPRFWAQAFGTLLYGVAYRGSKERVRYLLWLHPDVEARETICQSTALMAAATAGHLAMVRYLLAHGADVNACNDHGGTALMRSARKGYLELTRLLLESGAEVNARTKHGETAFIEAAKAGDADTMQLLLEYGADMFAAGPFSMDALIWATGMGQTHIVAFLLQQGMSVAGRRGQTALMLAKRKNCTPVLSLLRQAGVVDPA